MESRRKTRCVRPLERNAPPLLFLFQLSDDVLCFWLMLYQPYGFPPERPDGVKLEIRSDDLGSRGAVSS